MRIDSPIAWPLAALADVFRAFSKNGDCVPEPAFSLRKRRGGGYQVIRHLPDGANKETPASREHLVPVLEREINQRFAASVTGHLMLHAAAIACGDKAVLLPAPSGSGKSTLAAALVERGCGYLTDELALLALCSGEITPYPKAFSLKEGSFDYFARLGLKPVGGEWSRIAYLDPERLRPGCVVRQPLRVAGVVLPRYHPAAAAELEPLTPGETVIALFGNTINIARYKEKGLDLMIDLAREVRGYRLDFQDLEKACAALLEEFLTQA